jgi:ribosomal protein L11 methyltransferase
MPWLQLTTHLPSQYADAAAEALEEAGAIAVTLQDAAGEIVIETVWEQTPLWSKVCLSALLPEDADAAVVERELAQRLGLEQPLECRFERVDDQDWAHAWKQHYKPIHMGGRLWICPSWCEPPAPDGINVILDPGMAFGTGDHPTTALCLEWLARQELHGKVVLDYGCGSGILAIAALKLGARSACAVDLDAQALTVARENAARNGVADRLEVLSAAALPADFRAEFVLANILAGALIELAPRLIAHTRPGGALVLSGLLTEQAGMVRPHYCPPFDLAMRERGGWIALAGSRS